MLIFPSYSKPKFPIMRKSYSFFAALLMAVILSTAANAQNVTISGSVRNESTKDGVPAASVVVKGTSQGTFTNSNGEFSLKVAKLPVVLVFSSVGYDNQEITVSSASQSITVDFKVNNSLGQEVVVASTRTAIRSLEAPVTIERMGSASLRASAAPSMYEALSNLKGVDVHTASMTFRTVTTRGFVSSGNTRLNQLVDGMDNQAPGLNFSVSSIVGLTDLDVDNIEILSGASSALYGSGGMNGTVLISSKNPFKYQGLSYNIKQGMMHVDGKQRSAAPYYNWTFRYAKAINNKFAYKVSAEIMKGSDWQAEDYRNKGQIGILSGVKGGNRLNDPNYNGVNVYGDETDINMDAYSYFVQDQTRRGILTATGGGVDVVNLLNTYYGAIGNPKYPTNGQRDGFYTFAPFAAIILNPVTGLTLQQLLNSPTLKPNIDNMFPFYNGFKNGYYRNTNVSRTGYNEDDLVDYNTLNAKVNAAFHWKITEKIEASWNSYFGTGTTVYTGANRYSLRNFKMAQHKFEVKAKNWMVRSYTTQENAGDSYIGDAVGSFVNEAYSPTGTVWLPTYVTLFSENRRGGGPLGAAGTSSSDINLHTFSRTIADANRLQPGTPQFNAAAAKIKSVSVNKKDGSKFLDKSDLWAAEGQLNLSDALRFSDKLEVIVGAQWKQWVMNSQGTIFADTLGAIKVNETGGYIQIKKKLLNDVLTLSASGRYDKQTNFEGKFTPRFAAVIRVAKDNNIRLSYQTSYRFPSNQNQYISLRLGGGSSFLIGSLPEFQSYYKLNSTKPGYTIASVLNYRAGALADSSRLIKAVFNELKPETVNSYEIGYKGIIGKKLLVDAYFYYRKYDNFIVSQAVVQSQTGPNYELYSNFSSNNVSYNQNSTKIVKTNGWGIGIEYKLLKNYMLYGNVFSDVLKDVAPGDVTFFNAPKYRVNVGLRNDNVCHNIGFNIVAKWQDNNYYEGTFVSGTLPYFTWVDAQVTYKPAKTKSTFRVGGTNLGNNYYRTGYGSPAVGGLYYISYGYNL
jgi:outer membrane receptor protein involved in Fe transport